MRREELYLRDIVEASGYIAQFVSGLDRPGFQASELVPSAVVQKLAVIGEVLWPKIVAFRNILVHSYFGIDWDEVWRAATKESPFLQAQIEMILQSELDGP
jgi:uncharacterized protein with HEPN domain